MLSTPMLKEGLKAPDFALKGTDNATHALGEFKGHVLVLFLYIKDDTPICTIEAIEFNKLIDEFGAAGAVVVGLSNDFLDAHHKFKEKHRLKMLLLADPTCSTIKAYGSYGSPEFLKMGAHRDTFVIDGDGTIIKIYRKVQDCHKHPAEVLLFIKNSVMR